MLRTSFHCPRWCTKSGSRPQLWVRFNNSPPGVVRRDRSLLGEASRAVHRLDAFGFERDLGVLAARGAHGWVHPSCRATGTAVRASAASPVTVRLTVSLAAAERAAGWAPLGFILKTLVVVELLLPSGEHEVVAALRASQGLVVEGRHTWPTCATDVETSGLSVTVPPSALCDLGVQTGLSGLHRTGLYHRGL